MNNRSATLVRSKSWTVLLWTITTALYLTATQVHAGEDLRHQSSESSTQQHQAGTHGFALWGDLKYPSDFAHFDYVNPDAAKGGTVRLMGFGTFDTLNPYTLKGTSPFNTPGFFLYGISELNETLLIGADERSRSGDEILTGYGLIAERLELSDDLSWAVFHLRPEARFHDGHSIDSGDVIFSYRTLLEHGHPRFKQLLAGVTEVEALSPNSVKVSFKYPKARRDLLQFGSLPVLPEHYWHGKDFSRTTLEPPLLSGPYRVTRVDAGQQLVYERVPDYWGHHLAVNQGRFNFDKVIVDFYRDQTVAFEAFKSGQLSIYIEYISKNWANGYDFPALKENRVTKLEIPHELPAGIQGFFINTRRAPFDDQRVREALAHMFDFEWTNKNLFHNAYTRTRSYFPNSKYAAEGSLSPGELALLKPFRDQLPPALFDGELPRFATDGSGRSRQAMRASLSLLKEAGWKITGGELRHTATGKQLSLELLYRQKSLERVLMPYVQNLRKLGIQADLRLVDAAQYKNRLDTYDYDITTFVLPQSQAPGRELYEFFHSESVDMDGGRNYAGVNHPAIDALVEKAIDAESEDELAVTLMALDRVLLWQHYIVPNWYLGSFRVAFWAPLNRPQRQPPYTLGFENWWLEK